LSPVFSFEKLHVTGSRICEEADVAAIPIKRIAVNLKSLKFIMIEKFQYTKINNESGPAVNNRLKARQGYLPAIPEPLRPVR
jgi:hypothetical protein